MNTLLQSLLPPSSSRCPDDEGGELSAGLRPAPLCEPLPQEQVQRHTVEQVIETFVPVQALDAPVPQLGGEQVVEFFREFDALVVAEPVIKVPKISLVKARRRMGDYLRPTQAAEQLVEVPTVLSYSSLLLRTAEQIVHIPVPQDCGGCGGEGGPQGFSPGLGSTAHGGAEDLEHWVDEVGRCWIAGLPFEVVLAEHLRAGLVG